MYIWVISIFSKRTQKKVIDNLHWKWKATSAIVSFLWCWQYQGWIPSYGASLKLHQRRADFTLISCAARAESGLSCLETHPGLQESLQDGTTGDFSAPAAYAAPLCTRTAQLQLDFLTHHNQSVWNFHHRLSTSSGGQAETVARAGVVLWTPRPTIHKEVLTPGTGGWLVTLCFQKWCCSVDSLTNGGPHAWHRGFRSDIPRHSG